MTMTFSCFPAPTRWYPLMHSWAAAVSISCPSSFILVHSLGHTVLPRGRSGLKVAGQRDGKVRVLSQHWCLSWLTYIATSTVNKPSRAQQLVSCSALYLVYWYLSWLRCISARNCLHKQGWEKTQPFKNICFFFLVVVQVFPWSLTVYSFLAQNIAVPFGKCYYQH